jgi:hypothetical protein
MNITRRAATIGSFSLLAGSTLSGSALADFSDGFRIGEGLEDFGSPPMPTSTAIRS